MVQTLWAHAWLQIHALIGAGVMEADVREVGTEAAAAFDFARRLFDLGDFAESCPFKNGQARAAVALGPPCFLMQALETSVEFLQSAKALYQVKHTSG